MRIGDWGALTCTLEIRDIVQIGDTTYCATGGGLMLYNNGNFEVYTTVDGLQKVDVSSISKDNYKNVWIGGKSPNGFVQIYNIEKNNINIFDYGLTEITEFCIRDSIAFAAFIDGQDLGLIKWVYSEGEWSYRDIYRNFPFVIESINGLDIIDNTVFLATDYGLLKANMSENLKDPNSWALAFSEINGTVDAMCRFNSGFAFVANENVYRVFYDNINEYEEIDLPISVNFNDILFDDNDFIWGIDNRNIYSQKIDFEPILTDNNLYTISFDSEENIIVGSELGLIIIDNTTHKKTIYKPNAPVTGKFSSITVLRDGRLVGASSKGLSIQDFDGWRNILEIKYENTEVVKSSYNYNTFIADTIQYDFGDAVSDLEEGPDGLVYCAIEGTFPVLNNPSRLGGGILIIDVDNPENVTAIDTSILGYYTSGTSTNPYMVVKDIAFDNNGNLWAANAFSTNKNLPIHVRNLNNEWKSYGSSETSVKISQSPSSIVFDNWSRVWIGAF